MHTWLHCEKRNTGKFKYYPIKRRVFKGHRELAAQDKGQVEKIILAHSAQQDGYSQEHKTLLPQLDKAVPKPLTVVYSLTHTPPGCHLY